MQKLNYKLEIKITTQSVLNDWNSMGKARKFSILRIEKTWELHEDSNIFIKRNRIKDLMENSFLSIFNRKLVLLAFPMLFH